MYVKGACRLEPRTFSSRKSFFGCVRYFQSRVVVVVRVVLLHKKNHIKSRIVTLTNDLGVLSFNVIYLRTNYIVVSHM